jgi:uncharacterized protein YndB with AHSA1/START domain
MPVTNIEKSPENLTMVVTSEFEAEPGRVWQMWEDPRLLERWWGPPTWPATFVDHEFTVGGRASYFMTGPEGDKARGWWRFEAIEPTHRIELTDGFAGEDGEPDDGMPTMAVRVSIGQDGASGSATRMTIESRFDSIEEMEKLVEMGMEEGITLAIGQIDELLQP